MNTTRHKDFELKHDSNICNKEDEQYLKKS